MSQDVVRALALAFQYCGQSMPDLAVEEMAIDLDAYPKPGVLVALRRCRSELRSIKFSDILDRIPGGHPGPEEAWAMISRAMHDETISLIWTDEMREAYGIAHAIQDDNVAARMAFKESYSRAVSLARSERRAPAWSVSRGTDKTMLEQVLALGVKDGKISPTYAQRLVPDFTDQYAVALLAQYAPKLLE